MKCMYCKHWKKEDNVVDDEYTYGWCDKFEWGMYGGDPMCVDFEHK